MANNIVHRQFLRGSATQNDTYTGLEGEVTFDLTNMTLRLHSGQKPGGVALAKSADLSSLEARVKALETWITDHQADIDAAYSAIKGE